jgi:ElaB/YqjD/DUF883 family membrane-anchored ribosome-binding protein
MERDDRTMGGGFGDGMGQSGSDDRFGSGSLGGAAGAANTPSFGADRSLGGTPDPRESDHMQGGSAPSGSGQGALEEGKEAVAERLEGMRNRVEEQLDQGMRTTADRMEGIAARIDQLADERMSGEGIRGRAGNVAHTVADRMEGTADYLRSNDAHDLIGRLEDKVRERPLEMVLASVATGWLIGKILR